MTFQKGNKLACGTHKQKAQEWENIKMWLVGEGGGSYLEKLHMQAHGEELNEHEREFMNRFESLLEYHAPKLARIEERRSGSIDVKFDDSKAGKILKIIHEANSGGG